MEEIDLEIFRITGRESIVGELEHVQEHRMPRTLRVPFVRPCPVPWLRAAAALPGKALVCALACWYAAGKAKSRSAKVTGKTLDEFGIRRQTFLFGLKALEQANLITVDRHRGRCPIVTILLAEDHA